MRLALPRPMVLVRRQILCIAIAAIVCAFFWGNGEPFKLSTVLLYSLALGNLIMPALDALQFIYWKRPFPCNWIFFLLVVLVLIGPVYAIASVVVWWLSPPSPQSLWHLIGTGWKLPAVVTFLFSLFTYLYAITKEKLEQRNRELLRSVEQGAAQLEVQEQELKRAREIQQSLLPRQIPQLAGFEVAAAWWPARTVSGDYYDVFKLDEHRLGVCIADVAGKGVSAALLMANVQAAVRAFAGSAGSPAELCAKVNRLLCENLAAGKFVTFLYAVLDGQTRTLHYCNAGNVHPILVTSGESRTLEKAGAVLGVFPDWSYEGEAVSLRSGDRLLLATDGITEASEPDGPEFGEESLALAGRTHSKRSAAELNSLILEQVSLFCRAQFQDDATLLVIAAR